LSSRIEHFSTVEQISLIDTILLLSTRSMWFGVAHIRFCSSPKHRTFPTSGSPNLIVTLEVVGKTGLLPPQIVILPMQAPPGSLAAVLSALSKVVVESSLGVLTSVVVESAPWVVTCDVVESTPGVLTSVVVDNAPGVLTLVVLGLTAVVPPVTGVEVVPGRLHPVEVAVPSHNGSA
jgi:hypothetical protein